MSAGWNLQNTEAGGLDRKILSNYVVVNLTQV